MMKKNWAWLAGLLILLSGCYKYKETGNVKNPAYLRVFNSIPTDIGSLGATASPFLCFLMDPVFDGNGVPTGGAAVGDWLQVRELYTMSYSVDAGTALNAGNGDYSTNPSNPLLNYATNANYDYPGKLHVPAAGAINGLDLSAWAEIPSGKHRFLFITRPQSNTAFADLSAAIRGSVIIDTTIDLTAGDVYTLEAVESDIDNAKYGAYLRNEQFARQTFDPGRMYAAFYNLNGAPSFLTTNSSLPDYYFLADTLIVHYTYNILDDNYIDSVTQAQPNYTPPVYPLSTANNVYMGTVIRGRDDLSVFTPIPFLSRNYFFDEQGVLRTYFEGITGERVGTMPYVSFSFQRNSVGATPYPLLQCDVDPTVYNTLNPNSVNYFGGDPYLNSPLPFAYQASLNQVVQSDTTLGFYPTVNVFEIIYNRIYLMQLERSFEKVPD